MLRSIRVSGYTVLRGFSRLGLPLIALSLFTLFGSRTVFAEESHPGIGIESMYSEAVLAYSRKQSDQAIAILDQLLRDNPSHVGALELKALALKEKGQEKRSLEVYKKLIELKPLKERGPYHFQVGVIVNDEKKPELARPHFERALALRFNEVPSHLFLGLIAFNAGDMASAQPHFEQVRKMGRGELQVVGTYYLGLVDFRNGYSAGGTSELIAARALAGELPESKMASDIKTSADKILEPFNVGKWFANISVLSGYDSNIALASSNGSTSSQASSGMGTPKFTLSAGLGHMGSPLQSVQWVWSIRSSFNRNLSTSTHEYEFASGTASLYANFQPLRTTNAGLKLEGTYTFQNQLQSGTSDSYLYAPYNLAAEMGPYVRYNPDRATQLEWDVYLRPVKYVNDDGAQTGGSVYTRASWTRNTGSRAWNPGAYLSLEKTHTGSLDWAYSGYGLGLYDVLRLGARDTVNLSGDFSSRDYSDASIPRQDKNFALRANVVHSWSARYSILGDLSYTKNISNLDDVYSYNQLVMSAGISWTL